MEPVGLDSWPGPRLTTTVSATVQCCQSFMPSRPRLRNEKGIGTFRAAGSRLFCLASPLLHVQPFQQDSATEKAASFWGGLGPRGGLGPKGGLGPTGSGELKTSSSSSSSNRERWRVGHLSCRSLGLPSCRSVGLPLPSYRSVGFPLPSCRSLLPLGPLNLVALALALDVDLK